MNDEEQNNVSDPEEYVTTCGSIIIVSKGVIK